MLTILVFQLKKAGVGLHPNPAQGIQRWWRATGADRVLFLKSQILQGGSFFLDGGFLK